MRPFPGLIALRRLAISALVLGLCGACSWQGSLRPTVNLRIDKPKPNTIQGWGYPASTNHPALNRYYSLSIRLRDAPSFKFTFPDGYVANSGSINELILSTHLAPVVKGDKGERVSRISVAEGRMNYSIVFHIGHDGIAESLWLYSCKHTLPRLLSTADGTRVFDFPLQEEEIRELFGEPIQVGHDFVIIGYECE